MKLVALSCVRKLSHLLLHTISLGQLHKVDRSNRLPIVRDYYAELNLKFDTTKDRFSRLW